jgi:ATP-dependent Clp protease protease subunit
MIHQPLGGMPMSQATDFEIHNRHIQLTKQRLIAILARACGRTVEEIGRDTERDCYLNVEEAVAYGLVDEIIASRKEDMA